MKKSTIEKIEKEIDEKTKLPHEVKDKINREVFSNIAVAVVIITYFIFIVLGSIGSIKNVRTVDINIFSMLFLGVAIVLFEVAYMKGEGSFAIFGIESLAVAIFTLFLPYIIFELDEAHKKYYLLSSIYIAVYYIIKSICISTKIKSKYMDSISDVKEIVRKEKPKRRIKEDIIELEKESKIMDENIKNAKKDVRIDIFDDPRKKQTKKRGRPKKETSEEGKKEKATPKKRGRPRKAVINND